MKRQRTLASAVLWVSLVASGGIGAHVSAAAGQQSESPAAADSIRCWWKSGKSAVYVGERFPLTVTCRIVDTPAVRVGVEESALDSAAVQLSPFDVVDGTRYPDLQGDGHRFFQYQYSLRIIADDLFGREVSIPPLDVRYRVLRTTGQGPAVEGPELVYRLPALPVRITALASAQAVDIRDAPAETVGEIQSRRLRGSIALALAALLFSAALGCVALAAGSVMRRYRTPPRVTRLSEGQVLHDAIRTVQRLRQEVDKTGWTPDAIGQTLAAVRLGMAIAMGQRPPQTVVDDEARSQEGALIIHSGFIRPQRVMVSASVTAETLSTRLARSGGPLTGVLPGDVRGPLDVFTAAHYGRTEQVPRAELDRALDDALSLLRRVRTERSWRNGTSEAIVRAIARRLGPRARIW